MKMMFTPSIIIVFIFIMVSVLTFKPLRVIVVSFSVIVISLKVIVIIFIVFFGPTIKFPIISALIITVRL